MAATQPAPAYAEYRSTARRVPRAPLIPLVPTALETSKPRLASPLPLARCDLTAMAGEPPQGERIIVRGRVLDEDGHAVPHALIELWQANAAGRYRHPGDQHQAPLNPNFDGAGRVLTDADGNYEFLTIKPGAYPWRNHANAWRPAHLHFSVFGECLLARLVTQMYFPGDPLLAFDPIFHSVFSQAARERLIGRFDLSVTQPEFALGFRFDIVLGGRAATPADPA